jgi:cytochrome c oxidase assembly factor CtaG
MILHTATRQVNDLALWTHWASEPGSTIAIVATAGVYAAGVRASWLHAGIGRGVRRWQAWCFALGLVVLAVALMTPLDPMAEDLFSAHMVQHVLLAIVVPPLLVLGAPLTATVWALPPSARRSVTRAVKRIEWLSASWRMLTAPTIAWVIHGVALWSWHVPRLYSLALEHPAVHAVEHASFVGTAGLMWWSILCPRQSRRTAYGFGVLILFATMLHSAALGALITLSHRVWFPIHASGAAVWGLTALEDQQLAGLIMWVPGGLLYLAAMGALFLAWMRRNENTRRAASAAALAALALSGCARAEGSIVPGGNVERGRESIGAAGCGSCHTVAGVTGAHGLVGPPLTGVASRSMIAGELPNTPENMERWIMNPPAVEPGTAMPNSHVSEQEARDIVAYLYTLR